MSFADRLLRRRTPLTDITGFAGGNLQDQLERDQLDQQPQQSTGQILTPTNQENITRPRQVNPFQQRLMQSDTRPRISDPTSFDVEHLRELQSKPLGFRDKLGLALQNVSTNLGGHPLQTRRQREEGDVAGRVGQDLELEKMGTQRAIAQSQ